MKLILTPLPVKGVDEICFRRDKKGKKTKNKQKRDKNGKPHHEIVKADLEIMIWKHGLKVTTETILNVTFQFTKNTIELKICASSTCSEWSVNCKTQCGRTGKKNKSCIQNSWFVTRKLLLKEPNTGSGLIYAHSQSVVRQREGKKRQITKSTVAS